MCVIVFNFMWENMSIMCFFFQHLYQLPHTQVEVELSYIEIYNEQIYDLLGGMSSAGGREPLRVREDPHSGPYVEGVAHHAVSSVEHLMVSLFTMDKSRRCTFVVLYV